MPYAGLDHPSIAIGLLKAGLNRAGIKSKAFYANFKFAEEIGLARYQSIDIRQAGDLVGEWTFSESAFPDFSPNHQKYFELLKLKPERQEILWEIRKAATQFVDRVAQQIIDLQPQIVSCSSTFQQHCPSLALLRRIRELNPNIITLMGGANCEGVMGVTTHREFPWVDFVVSGEGDELFVELCSLLLANGRNLDSQKLPYGVIDRVDRNQDETPLVAPRATAHNLDEIPIPDYDDYFETWRNSPLNSLVRPGLLVETSRGCWWGERSHCTFCGLNGTGMTYRTKSLTRIIEELVFLSKRYGINRFEVVDNILSTSYFDQLLPILAAHKERFEIFYETKANLNRQQVKQLVEAGVRWIQPGIEGLHDSILRLMKKGTNAAINVQLLKWAREYGLRLSWHMLYDLPGDRDEWYLEMAQWLPLIIHLEPPSGLLKTQYHRFSPYHERPEDFGIETAPFRTYAYVYPLSKEAIADLAYFFEESAEQNRDQSMLAKKMGCSGFKAALDFMVQWIDMFWSALPPLLCMSEQGERLQIVDTRPCAIDRVFYLEGLNRRIYLLCDQALTPRELIKALRNKYELALSWQEIQPAIDELQKLKILVKLSGRFLSLAVAGDIPRLWTEREFPGGYTDISCDRESFLIYSDSISIDA